MEGELNDDSRALYASVDPVSAKLSELAELQVRVAKEEVAESQRVDARTRFVLVLASSFSLLFALAAGLVVSHSVTDAVQEARRAVQKVAAGDLTSGVTASGKDEISELLGALALMKLRLSEIVATVAGEAQSLACASGQIAQGNLELSGRTEDQASALEQVASTMEQLSSTVRNTADGAKQVEQMARLAASVAIRGGEVVGQVVNTMRAISGSSQMIGEIIAVIDSIAFQTNILALNAAVEAARAGEQGRGFSVVAGEVQVLARRSADAAKEIKELISRNVEHVSLGATLVDHAGQTMSEIVSSVQGVSDIVSSISAATVEQSDGIQQVVEVISQMDLVTQQNAALVEESASAATSLRSQSQCLLQAVAAFQIDPK